MPEEELDLGGEPPSAARQSILARAVDEEGAGVAEESRPATPSDPSAVRTLLQQAAAAEAAIRELHEGEERLHEAVRTAYQASHAAAVRGQLLAIPIERLRDVTGARLPV